MASASVYLVGVLNNELFTKMIAIKKYCEEQGVSYPDEVKDYFGEFVDEDEFYIAEEMNEKEIIALDGGGVMSYATVIPFTECHQGDDICLEFNIEDIPADIKTLRLKLSF